MDRRCWSAALAGCLLLAVAGCKMLPEEAAGAGPGVTFQRHPMSGLVLAKVGEGQQVTVQQGVIPNFMPAMNAVYSVPETGVFRELQPGDRITGVVLAPSDGSENRLAEIAITSEPTHPMTPEELPPHELLIGEAVPDIPMVNQAGKAVQFPEFRGKALLLTFVDSKCTEDCPIITGRFQKVDRMLEQDGQAYAGSHLLTVSIDPANDTPPVLRQYGLKYLGGDAKGFAHWSFVDTTPANLKKLAAAFGVIYRPSGDGDIVHTMVTALVGPDGTLRQVWGGDDWNAAQVAQAVAAAAKS